ncbi:hypothetical protein [Parafrigoribacterium soli]|uniref:hypothetical protein n=1 Tax=Parafrigoribacterium soli TaxID=3144663 RepID=UPI0032ED0C8E
MTSPTALIEALPLGTWLYWSLLLAITTASLVFAALAASKRLFAWVAAGLLVLAIVFASLGSSHPPFGVTALLALLCIALAIVGGSPAVIVTLGLAGGENPAGRHGGILVRASGVDTAAIDTAAIETAAKREVLRGGSTIGILERLAVAAAIVAGHPEAIALIVALKGVGRFTELDAAEARERFIIGSLVSLVWGCASAAVFVIALN